MYENTYRKKQMKFWYMCTHCLVLSLCSNRLPYKYYMYKILSGRQPGKSGMIREIIENWKIQKCDVIFGNS